jgi:hypothetical protein
MSAIIEEGENLERELPLLEALPCLPNKYIYSCKGT